MDLAGTAHVCAFTLRSSEHEKQLASLIADSPRSRRKTILIVDPRTRAGRPGAPAPGRSSGSPHVELLDWTETYLEFGRFDPGTMLTTIERLVERGAAEGYDPVRIVGDLGWAAVGADGAELLLAYESGLDMLVSGREAEIVCVYNLPEFSRAVATELIGGDPRLDANLLVDVLHVHPTLIVHGEVFSNPVYQGGTSAVDGLPAGGTMNR